MITLPPLPPSPPEGPPRGTYFSLRNARQPLPPSPALTQIFASSTNTAHSQCWGKGYARATRKHKAARPEDHFAGISLQAAKSGAFFRSSIRRCSGGLRIRLRTRNHLEWQNADEAAHAALVFKAHDARNAGEERIVLAAAHGQARLVARPPLTDQDASARDELPGKSLDPEPLPLRIAPVRGRPAALFMR